MEAIEKDRDLADNLSAAAHLIHGSSEGRFSITYCPGRLSRSEVEQVGFSYAPLTEMLQRFDPERLRNGPNTLRCGEEIYFIGNPAIGLWAREDRFIASQG